MDIALTISNRQISPAVVNLFQFESGTTTLNFTLDSYMYGEVDLRNYTAYAVTSINGSVDMTELVATYDASKDKLTLSWDVKEYTLLEAGAILYQIVFKESTASGIPEEGENTGVFYSYKAVIINRESIDPDNEISAKYPTILKQWLDRMNAMADLYDAGVVYMNYGESIPAADRLAGRLYFQYTDSSNTRGQFEDDKGNILSDLAVVHNIGDETIAGTKTFTMSPKVPTPAVGDDSTKTATTAWVNAKAKDYVKSVNGSTPDENGNVQVADAESANKDGKGNVIADTYLPLAGGTLTGKVTGTDLNLSGNIYGVSDDGRIIIGSGTSWSKGGHLALSGKGYSDNGGGFNLVATDGTTRREFIGKLDGGLSWNGEAIVRLVAEQKPTSSNGCTWYRKYSDGWVEQGGTIDVTRGNFNVNLPIEMASTDYTVVVTRNSGASATSQIDIWRKTANDTTTTFCVYITGDSTGVIYHVCGMAA